MKKAEWKSSGNCVYDVWYHVVWSTKYRRSSRGSRHFIYEEEEDVYDPYFQHLPESVKRQINPRYRREAEEREAHDRVQRLLPLVERGMGYIRDTDLKWRQWLTRLPHANPDTLARFLNHAERQGLLHPHERRALLGASSPVDAPVVMAVALLLVVSRREMQEGITSSFWPALLSDAARICQGSYPALCRLLRLEAERIR